MLQNVTILQMNKFFLSRISGIFVIISYEKYYYYSFQIAESVEQAQVSDWWLTESESRWKTTDYDCLKQAMTK